MKLIVLSEKKIPRIFENRKRSTGSEFTKELFRKRVAAFSFCNPSFMGTHSTKCDNKIKSSSFDA
jgi:hypothetical protein